MPLTDEDYSIMRTLSMHELGEYLDADLRDFLIMNERMTGRKMHLKRRIPKWAITSTEPQNIEANNNGIAPDSNLEESAICADDLGGQRGHD
jgi:hypothetical protein